MIRSRHEQNKLNSEIDRRLLEFQTPKEITMSVETCQQNVFRRAIMLGLIAHRITQEERDHLLVRRKVVTK
jgi:hypothetical protein